MERRAKDGTYYRQVGPDEWVSAERDAFDPDQYIAQTKKESGPWENFQREPLGRLYINTTNWIDGNPAYAADRLGWILAAISVTAVIMATLYGLRRWLAWLSS